MQPLSLLGITAISLLTLVQNPSAAGPVTDIPKGHWASPAVQQVVARGIMKAPGGKFAGSTPVTRRELAVTLAAFARNLDQGWAGSGTKPVAKTVRDRGPLATGSVSRYELAAILVRAAGYAAKGVPKARGKVYGNSEAFPPAPKVTLSPSDPAYESVKYLASRRMLLGSSVLMKPGGEPVTPSELTLAVSWVLIGLSDQYTDEPQNREELTPPPNRHPH